MSGDFDRTYRDDEASRLADSLRADIRMGGYDGKPHGGNFAALVELDPQLAVTLVEELLVALGRQPEDLPTVRGIAELLYWEDTEAPEEFIRRHSPADDGGDVIRHNGQPAADAAELAEFFVDVESLRQRQASPPKERTIGAGLLRIFPNSGPVKE